MRVDNFIGNTEYRDDDYDSVASRKLRRRSTKRPTLLWVDDNADLLELYQVIYQRLGFEVLTASSPEVALENSEDADIVILDYDMPDMNGAVLASLLKTRNAQKPIILHSANSCVPSPANRWIDAFCLKGAPREELLQTIDRLCSNPSQHNVDLCEGMICAIGTLKGKEEEETRRVYLQLTSPVYAPETEHQY